MRERIQFTQGLAARHGHRITDVADWRPLLRYSDGNPLTITVVVGQALRAGYRTSAQIEGFVARLRAGEADLDDADEAQGRSRSLAASLTYGLTAAFTEAERAQLAVLGVFQDTVDVDALVAMGDARNPWAVPALAGLTRETGLDLLGRAAEIGLLTAIGGGYFAIHPALPWFFRQLYPVGTDRDTTVPVRAAYIAVIANFGDTYHNWYEQGRADVVNLLQLEEANLLRARSLARAAGRRREMMGCMQGLRILYEHTGRGAEWARLVDELVPDIVDPDTGAARPGLAEEWALFTTYRVAIALGGRDWTSALQLQQTLVGHYEREAAAALATAPDQRTDTDRHRIRDVAVGEQALGHVFREQQDPACVAHYHRAVELLRAIGDRRGEGTIAFNLGHAYVNIPSLRDLDQAEHWYRRDLELMDEQDLLGRARTVGQLGRVAYGRLVDARAAGQPESVLLRHLNDAATAYRDALGLLPADAKPELATVHHQLGVIYTLAGEYDTALNHYQQSIRLEEASGNRYGAGQTRHTVAILFARAGRTSDALLYAQAALADYAPYGAGAAAAVEEVHQLIARLGPPTGAP